MNYWIFIFAIIVASFVICLFLSSKDKSTLYKDGAHLSKLDNTDMPCGKAFESLDLYNAWGEND